MDNQILLPKKDEDGKQYISYSQLSKFKKSKREYIRDYFFGEDTSSEALKKYGEFGSRVGESFENSDFSKWDREGEAFLKSLPHFDEFERKIKLDMGSYYVLGFVDSNTKPEKIGRSNKLWVREIVDYKTGEIEKRRPDYESEDYNQLEIYSGALLQEFGRLPEKVSVVLIGRAGNAFKGEELTLTKEAAIIPKEIDLEAVERVKESIDKTVKEISDLYKAFLKLKGNG